jgi:hypothetical protein
MKKTRGFLFTAGILLAMVFTFSCSSDDGGDPDTGGSFGLPTQVYRVEMDNDHQIVLSRKEYSGNGNVFVRMSDNTPLEPPPPLEPFYPLQMREYGSIYDGYDFLPAGNIKNGKLSLNLPASIDSKYYLNELWDCYIDKEHGGEDYCQLSIAPQNLTYAYAERFFVAIPGESDYCLIEFRQIGSEEMYRRGWGGFIYSPEPGKVTGPREGEILNLNFSKGWNSIFVYRYSSDADDIEYWTNDLPAGIKLEWMLRCAIK